jgi:hypothetical protein
MMRELEKKVGVVNRQAHLANFTLELVPYRSVKRAYKLPHPCPEMAENHPPDTS